MEPIKTDAELSKSTTPKTTAINLNENYNAYASTDSREPTAAKPTLKSPEERKETAAEEAAASKREKNLRGSFEDFGGDVAASAAEMFSGLGDLGDTFGGGMAEGTALLGDGVSLVGDSASKVLGFFGSATSSVFDIVGSVVPGTGERTAAGAGEAPVERLMGSEDKS